MDQKQSNDIVRSVMAQMGHTGTNAEAVAAATHAALNQGNTSVESVALDLGSQEAKQWIGVQNPHRAEVLQELRNSTGSRVCSGRAGVRPRTQSLLRFLADHSRSKDTVLKEVPAEWVKKQNLLELQSADGRSPFSPLP